MNIIDKRMLVVPAAVALMSFGAGAAFAQQQQGLVTVNLQNVANNLAQDLDVNVSNIPVTVQVPVSLAANLCNVDANVLSQQTSGGDTAECTAESSSQALADIVQEQTSSQGQGGQNQGGQNQGGQNQGGQNQGGQNQGGQNQGGSQNSARDSAPGQQEGSARANAPGQQEGSARENAPGQQKKKD
jgi:hypothetical protein